MIIVFEGPKFSGKSTAIKLAAKILKERGFEVVVEKFDRSDDPTHDMLLRIRELADLGRTPEGFKVVHLIDRFHLTEYVYRMADGNFPISEQVLVEDTILIQRMLLAARATVIVMQCNDELERLERITLRGYPLDQTLDTPEALELWKSTCDAFNKRYHNVVSMDTSNKKKEAVALAAVQFVEYSIQQKLHI
jgi:thymidylate kinase